MSVKESVETETCERKDYGSRFGQLVDFLIKISNRAYDEVERVDIINSQLRMTPKKIWLRKNPKYESGVSQIKTGLTDLKREIGEVVSEFYGDVEYNCDIPSFVSQFPASRWLNVRLLPDDVLIGNVTDYGDAFQPNISVGLDTDYKPEYSQIEFLDKIKGLDIKTADTTNKPEIIFNPSIKNLLDKRGESLEKLIEGDQFSAKIPLRRPAKTFASDGTPTRIAGSEVSFRGVVKTSPDLVDLYAEYKILAKRDKITLPEREKKWIRNTINTLTQTRTSP